MIIVEGADNSGKSTLVRQLIELDPRLRLLRRERFKPEQGDTIGSSYIEALLPNDGDRVAHGYGIADRLVASEVVYGELFRNGHRLSLGEQMAINHLLDSYEAIVVHCDPPDTSFEKTWAEREQLYDDPLRIARAYRERMPEIFKGRVLFTYDWTSTQAEETRQLIIEYHARLQSLLHEALSWWSAIPFGAGCLRSPEIVVVGEALTPRSSGGEYFAQVWADLPHGSTFITSVTKHTNRDASILREEMNFLLDQAQCRTAVLLLGRTAWSTWDYIESTLVRHPTVVARAPHPQFWSRYHHDDRREYRDMIDSALREVQ